MQKLITLGLDLVKNKVFVLGGLLFVSVFSLCVALSAEVFFDIEPCVLCIAQRFPFLLVIFLSLAGLIWRKNERLVTTMVFLNGIAFLVNSGIALYQTGVQQRWWISDIDGCKVPPIAPEHQSVLENIFSAPTARCDEISWADPIFGLTFANLNVAVCLGLFLGCMLCLYLNKKAKA